MIGSEILKTIIICHFTAFFGGFILDLIFGDPHSLPHPVRLIGRMISLLDRKMNSCRKRESTIRAEMIKGSFMVILILIMTGIVSVAFIIISFSLCPTAGICIESIMTYQILAARSLRDESMKVQHCLENGDIGNARKAVSMIVGRDTEILDKEGIIKAAVETVAENTSDGVIAPMLYLMIGGPTAGFLYKAVNTIDSMVGYKNEKYMYFGRPAAKLDDVLNYLPSRISALLVIAVSFIGGREYDGRRAAMIWKRDRMKHASPNSAQTEAAFAGALGIRLAGDASYFGHVVRKPYIGDACRKIEIEDIARADRLMYTVSFICWTVCLFVIGGTALWL